MTTGMTIAVNGASGYTGKLVTAELARRGLQAVMVGRNLDRLRSAGPAAFERRIADIADEAALVEAFGGCDVVINCAGPFSSLGEPVIRAASPLAATTSTPQASRATSWMSSRRLPTTPSVPVSP